LLALGESNVCCFFGLNRASFHLLIAIRKKKNPTLTPSQTRRVIAKAIQIKPLAGLRPSLMLLERMRPCQCALSTIK